MLGESVDLMAATLGYGRITAELAYGQSESIEGPPQEVLMLSTDLAAWSWLTLESDLALARAAAPSTASVIEIVSRWRRAASGCA